MVRWCVDDVVKGVVVDVFVLLGIFLFWRDWSVIDNFCYVFKCGVGLCGFNVV